MVVEELLISRVNPAGFFSNFFWVLAGLDQAEKTEKTPVVSLRKVARPAGVLTTLMGRNIFPYDFNDYFTLKKPGIRAVSAFDVSIPVSEPQDAFTFMGAGPVELGRIYRRNLRITDWVQEVLEDVRETLGLNSGKYISVHSRYSDMRWQPSHPTPPHPKQILAASLSEMDELNENVLFISADNLKVVRTFSKAHSATALILSLDRYQGKFKEKLKDDPNLEVLIEALIHSESASLVHSSSSVSFAARVLRQTDAWRRVSLNCGTNPSSLPGAIISSYLRSVTAAVDSTRCQQLIFNTR